MFPYGINVLKVCESEMLSKNKLSELDEDKNTPKDKDKDNDKDKDKTRTKDKDKTTPKTRTKTEDKDKTTPKTKTKIEDKDEDIDMDRDKVIQVFQHAELGRSKKGNWVKRQTVWVFGMVDMYQNYAKIGYVITMNMHTHGLKSFTHILVRCFLLESIRQPHQKIHQHPRSY